MRNGSLKRWLQARRPVARAPDAEGDAHSDADTPSSPLAPPPPRPMTIELTANGPVAVADDRPKRAPGRTLVASVAAVAVVAVISTGLVRAKPDDVHPRPRPARRGPRQVGRRDLRRPRGATWPPAWARRRPPWPRPRPWPWHPTTTVAPPPVTAPPAAPHRGRARRPAGGGGRLGAGGGAGLGPPAVPRRADQRRGRSAVRDVALVAGRVAGRRRAPARGHHRSGHQRSAHRCRSGPGARGPGRRPEGGAGHHPRAPVLAGRVEPAAGGGGRRPPERASSPTGTRPVPAIPSTS